MNNNVHLKFDFILIMINKLMEIQGYPNYLIYPDGRVFSKKSNIFLKPNDNGRGYVYIQLYEGKRKMKNIHRLVAEHYIPNPENLKEVDHINRIRDDNRIENLRWVTSSTNSENRKYTKDHKNIPFEWISLQINVNKGKEYNSYCFSRKINGVQISKRRSSLSKVLCYSFFYLLATK